MMSDAIPSVFIYEYPTLAGPLLGTYDLEGEHLDDPEIRRCSRQCVGALAVPQDDGRLVLVGTVFRYPTAALGIALDVLLSGDAQTLWLHRDTVAATLLPASGPHLLECYAEEPWVHLFDVVLWFQYESDIQLLFLADELARIFLPARQQERIFRLGQGLFPAIERNRRGERQALRRAFTHALPHLLPGMRIAQKKPGYGWKKGRADFFLSQQGSSAPRGSCGSLSPRPVWRPSAKLCRRTTARAAMWLRLRSTRTWSWTITWSLCPLGARKDAVWTKRRSPQLL